MEPVLTLRTLKSRGDFIRLAGGRKWAAPGLVLQMRESPDLLRPALEAAQTLRVGYTVTKTVGGAVVRNRAKRRLRAAAAQILGRAGLAGHDYVLIGRKGTVDRAFVALLDDLSIAVTKVHRPGKTTGAAREGSGR